jgi:NAD(P)-dependent dehydrogenase (short-subunit alcohol dehydrogenase family)
VRMDGKVCLVTGGNSGVGKAAGLGLARLGACVIILCHDRKRGEDAREYIKRKSGNNNIELMLADLSVQDSIRGFARKFKEKYDKLHVLSNMAGVLLFQRQCTPDGIERTFATDYLSHFLLTHYLLEHLKAAGPSRIITVSGSRRILNKAKINFDNIQFERNYNGLQAAMQSTLARFIFTCELAKRLEGTKVTANTFDPKRVRSNLPRNLPWYGRFVYSMIKPFLKKECPTCIYLASSPNVDGISGKYFIDSRAVDFRPPGYTMAVSERLWKISEELTGLGRNDFFK